MPGRIKELSSRAKIAVGGAALLAVLAVVAWQVKSVDIPLVSEGHSVAQARVGSESQQTEGVPVEADLGRCVALWNKPSNDYGRQLISGYSEQPPYVNVDFSATFPDRCLITSANIDIGRAYQFIEGGQSGGELGPFGLPVSEGSVNELPPTDWNVASDTEGFLTLK